MNAPLRLASCAAGLMMLAGCASSLTESQCLAGDWQTVGYRDGSLGYASTRLLEHQDACVKHGVVPDRAQYMIGWQDGVVAFCTPENGFVQGEGGAGYVRVCPVELETQFLGAYKDGRTLYLAASEVDRLAALLDQKTHELAHVDESLVTLATRIAVETDVPAATRIGWVHESTELARSRGRLEGEIESIGIELAVQQERLTGLREQLAYRY